MRWIVRLSEHAKDILVVVVVALACALAATCLVATLFMVSEHNAEIHQIDVLAHQNHTLAAQRTHDLKVIHTDALEIEAFAQQIVQGIDQLHANQAAICVATPGCTLP